MPWALEGVKEGYILGYNVDFYQCSSPLRENKKPCMLSCCKRDLAEI